MDVEQVRYFLAVAETGSFTRAAARCGIAQPSLSQQMQNLEKKLGDRLFDRLPRKVMLTEAGRELLPRARKLVEAFEAFGKGVEKGPLRGVLTVGASATLAPFVVAEAAAAFAKRHHAVEVALHELPHETILEQVREGQCDLGIVGVGVDDPQILVESLFSEMLVVALPARHRLARNEEVTIGDLSAERLILLDELKEFFPARGEEKGAVIRGRGLQVATAEALVKGGAGVCVLPAMARERRSPGGIVYRRFHGHGPVRVVSAVWHRDRVRSREAVTFMEVLRGVVAQVL